MGTLNVTGPAPAGAPAPHERYQIRAEEDVGAARRAVGRMSARAGLPRGPAELAATELATNILRHAGADGFLLCQPGEGCLELLAADRGPGFGPGLGPGPGLRPGLGLGAAGLPPPGPAPGPGPRPFLPGSGAGLGVGLASVQRLATEFDSYSRPAGTVILARFGDPRRSSPDLARWGAVNVPLGGTGDSGDGWLVITDGRRLAALVVDGLGHGPAAAAAARAAAAALARRPVTEPSRSVIQAHEAMRGTRGGVLGLAVTDPIAGELTYAGVGNISGWVLHGGTRQGLLSREGTAGTQERPPHPHVMRVRWAAGATLILASDGIRTLRDLGSYTGLWQHDPALAACVLYRDHDRGTDDGCVLVVQDTRRSQP